MLSLLLFYSISGIVLVIVSIPLIQRWIKPNPLYGFRLSETIKDNKVWYEVNAHFGLRLLWVGILTIVTSIALYFVPEFGINSYALTCAAVILPALAICIIQSYRYMKLIANNNK